MGHFKWSNKIATQSDAMSMVVLASRWINKFDQTRMCPKDEWTYPIRWQRSLGDKLDDLRDEDDGVLCELRQIDRRMDGRRDGLILNNGLPKLPTH